MGRFHQIKPLLDPPLGKGRKREDSAKSNELKAKAREHLRIAKRMIEKSGYHCWNKEVEELEGMIWCWMSRHIPT
jgi:hypothetical protein